MIKANDVVFWRGPNGLHQRWADVVSVNGDRACIKLRHDTFDYSSNGVILKEGSILSVPLTELVYNYAYYESIERMNERMKLLEKLKNEKWQRNNPYPKPIAAGEIW